MTQRQLRQGFFSLALGLMLGIAQAQTYPTKPLLLVQPNVRQLLQMCRRLLKPIQIVLAKCGLASLLQPA